MDTHLVPTAVRQLERLIGHETALDHYHGELRRAVQAVQPVHGYGMVQVTCSDEFQGEIRASFERDVARPLTSGSIQGHRHTFALANMGGRLEAGALKLAYQHFITEDRQKRAKLLLVEITSHVGVITSGKGKEWGKLERFGQISDCCGALATLVAGSKQAAAVRHPWFDQLSAFFGEARLDVLRADATPTRMLAAAIVHAVLQAESAIADVLRDPPTIPVHVLIAPLVVFNQNGLENVLPVGVHHLFADGREVAIVHGNGLRSTPGALRFTGDAGRLQVTSDEPYEAPTERRAIATAPPELAQQLRAVTVSGGEEGRVRAELVQDEFHRARKQVDHLRKHPHLWRVYARPVLRGLVQGLSLIAPEVGIAAMLVETGVDAVRVQHLKHLLARGPTKAEARKALHDIEAEIQQLGHRDAQEVLDILVNEAKTLIA